MYKVILVYTSDKVRKCKSKEKIQLSKMLSKHQFLPSVIYIDEPQHVL